MGILLSDEESGNVYIPCEEKCMNRMPDIPTVKCLECVVYYHRKAQALKVLDELNKPCPHEPYKCLEVKRCDCYICLEEIRKELQDGSQT